jgi:hypothetical protein
MSQPLIGSWIDADALASATRELGGDEDWPLNGPLDPLPPLMTLTSSAEALMLGELKVAEVRAQLSNLHARASRMGLIGAAAGNGPSQATDRPASPLSAPPLASEYRPTRGDRLRRLIDWHGWLCSQQSLRGLFIIGPSGELLFEIGMRPDWWFALREKLNHTSPYTLTLPTATLHWWRNHDLTRSEVGWIGWIDDQSQEQSPLFQLMPPSFALAWGESAL